MGYHAEINTLFRLSKEDLKPEELKPGMRFTTAKPTARIYPVDGAVLLLAENWDVLGYCAIRRSEIRGAGTTMEVEVLSLFASEEAKIYTARLREALSKSGELAAKS
ncbi:hypothetical protein CO015_02130 [candidate division WWE3 bacterium CG_4_8_14_3_um_filter_42_11]|uniref:Uncharacterized protein n=1 Tax=candidate division WWE3 bacterium CG_4_8_14_3_um_filter_42_11 TaxID=1975076 RepID=A0A2M8G793_UNCKA|nr:MAG: hypothetical protein CO015_02130 [candidate division WWE3 bacterium CG_4_8_14_3_um_filter_42_11]